MGLEAFSCPCCLEASTANDVGVMKVTEAVPGRVPCRVPQQLLGQELPVMDIKREGVSQVKACHPGQCPGDCRLQCC